MSPRLPSRRTPPIGFASRGARAEVPENTIEAFTLARRLGATGLESDVWLTADGQAVLAREGAVGPRLRRRRIAEVTAAQLPQHVPRLAELYASCGTDFELSLNVSDPAAVAEVILVARDAEAEARLWLSHPDPDVVGSWRELSSTARLVHSTRLRAIKEGPERRAADMAAAGIDAINLHHSDWTGGLVALFHRFEREAFGADAQFERTIGALLDAGIDGVYGDHVDVMVAMIDARA